MGTQQTEPDRQEHGYTLDLSIPPSAPIDKFVNQLASHKDLPLSAAEQIDLLTPNIGNTDELPVSVNFTIRQIQDAETIGEKVAIAHSFASLYMSPVDQGVGDERLGLSFNDLVNNPYGDCDDFAYFIDSRRRRPATRLFYGRICRIYAHRNRFY